MFEYRYSSIFNHKKCIFTCGTDWSYEKNIPVNIKSEGITENANYYVIFAFIRYFDELISKAESECGSSN